MRVDVFQALKRALMRRGVLRVPNVEVGAIDSSAKPRSALPTGSTEKLTAEAPAEANNKLPTDENAKKEEEGPEEIVELTERTQDILFEADTIFPFTLFPDTVTLDREKLTIAERYFWRVAKITSVPISEILTCQVNVGPFFGSIHLVFSFFADNQRTIKFLSRGNATDLQRLLHGYIIANRREINTTNVSVEDLKIMLAEIGQGAEE